MDALDTLYALVRAHPERVALIAAGIWFLYWIEQRRCTGMIRRWCEEHGFRLIRARRSWGLLGAFPLASENQSVWRITAEDLKLGGKRRGHARCGGYFSGIWTDRVAVEWEFSARELSDGLDLPDTRVG